MRSSSLYLPADDATSTRMWAEIARAAALHRTLLGPARRPGAPSLIAESVAATSSFHQLELTIARAIRAGVNRTEIIDALASGDRHAFDADQVSEIVEGASRRT